jgi:membrane-bound ClpP family serine protease
MLHYGWVMRDRPALSRPLAIALVVLTGLAFVGILGGLAVGRIDIAGISGMVLVVLWFVVLGVRGRR